MNRRFCKLLSLWIVPLLLARALIPTGFMLAADTNGLSLVFCSPSAQRSVAAANHQNHLDAANRGHHEASNHEAALHHAGQGQSTDQSGDHRDHNTSASQHNAPCPFSLAAVVATGDVPYVMSSTVIPADERFESFSAPTSNVGPLRSEHIRGPPSLA